MTQHLLTVPSMLRPATFRMISDTALTFSIQISLHFKTTFNSEKFLSDSTDGLKTQGPLYWVLKSYCSVYTVKPFLRDHCHERPPVLKDQIFLAEGPTFQCNWTCHERPPALKNHICMANGVVFQDRFYCTLLCAPGDGISSSETA